MRIGVLPAELQKTDYDTQTELKERYEVVAQHTFVQVDENGDLVTKWIGGDVDVILDRVVSS